MTIKNLIRGVWQKWFDYQGELPQLLMWYLHSTPPEIGELKEGYQLRTYQEGDADGWVDLLNANGELGTWSRERIQREIDGALVKEAQYFVVGKQQLVGTAGVFARRYAGVDGWEIGWVAVHPEHQGKDLGLQVTAAAVVAALRLPERPIFLRTDDFRIPALKVYLKLGFVPDYQHSSYAGRWQRIFDELGEEYRRYRRRPQPASEERTAT